MLPDDDRPFDLRAQWRAIARRPWLVALAAIVGAATMLAMVSRASTTYVARAELETLPSVATWPTNTLGVLEATRLRTAPIVREVHRRDPGAPVNWRTIAGGYDPFLTIEVDETDRQLALKRLNNVVDAYLVVRSAQLTDEIALRIAGAELEVASAQAVLDRVRAGGSADPVAATDPQVAAGRNALETPPASGTVTVEAAQRRVASAQTLLRNLEAAKAAGPVIARVNSAPRIVGVLTPPDPSARNAAAGFVGGAFLGAAACLALEKLRDRVRSRRDAAAAAGPVPVLAVVPAGSSTAGVPEAVVALQAALGQPGGDGARVVLVAGVDDGAGAAELAASLSVSFAAAGGRVVALDADVRTPRLHTVFDVHETPGLTDVVAGRAGGPLGEIDTRGVVQPVASRRGLWAVPAGAAAPDPTAVATSRRTEALFGALRARVDWLVVHAAPVLDVADAVALGTLLDAGRHDGVVLAATAGRTTHRRLGDALDVLADAGIPVLGVVVTGAAPADCPAYVSGRE